MPRKNPSRRCVLRKKAAGMGVEGRALGHRPSSFDADDKRASAAKHLQAGIIRHESTPSRILLSPAKLFKSR